eukprot:6527354-Prymnesium_polylepis.1
MARRGAQMGQSHVWGIVHLRQVDSHSRSLLRRCDDSLAVGIPLPPRCFAVAVLRAHLRPDHPHRLGHEPSELQHADAGGGRLLAPVAIDATLYDPGTVVVGQLKH